MEAIGYVEVIGLSNAIMVGDHMLKAASVSVKNIENVFGGLITVSVTGDVAAVEAAIDAGKADSRIQVVSTTVLANPAEGIPELGQTDVFPTDPEPIKAKKAQTQPAKTTTASAKPAPRNTQVPAVKAQTAVTTNKQPASTAKTTNKTATKKPVSRRKTSRRSTTKRPTTNKSKPTDKPTDKGD